jgi:hypothetical protein
MLSFEVERPSPAMNARVLAALDSSTSANQARTSRALDHGAWNGRPVFARPRNWAIACVVALVVTLALAIPHTRRAETLPASGRNLRNLVAVEPGLAKSQASDLEAQKVTPEDDVQSALAGAPPPPGEELKAPENVGPMIVQTASLNILATNYDQASAAIDKLAAAHGGYVEKLDAKAQTGNARELTASLRIPTKHLDGFLADVRKLGRVEEETRSNEEVSDQYVDLQARLKSARATEQRLIELLGTRTGKLQDVLEAERELARVRGEIESMQGQSTILLHRVNYATVQVDLSEEYRQVLGSGPVSTGSKLRNALVEGFRNLQDGAVGLLVFLFAVGPSLLFWLAILLVPGWFAWRRFRARAQA